MGNKRVSVILMQRKSCSAMNLDKRAFLWLENMPCTVSQKNTGTVYAITSGLWFLPWLIFKCLRKNLQAYPKKVQKPITEKLN